MKEVNKYLVFLWKQNGPSSYQILVEVIETEEGYYFEKSGNSGYFQITETRFNSALEETQKIMPELHVEYSQPRKKVNKG